MTNNIDCQLILEDLLAELYFARKQDQLGRLALLAYCDVKGWARRAGKHDVAEVALKMFSENPCINRADFLVGIDALIHTLELHAKEYLRINNRHSQDESLSPHAIGEIARMPSRPHTNPTVNWPLAEPVAN